MRGGVLGGKTYRIGVLFSTSGPYDTISRSMLNGAQLALAEVNASEEYAFSLQPVISNPTGDLGLYARYAGEMLCSGIRHVIGGYTSSSRKEVIPLFEKHDALLWYPSHYEGFESSPNVIYTGAAPNQHIIPLIEYLIGNVGRRAFCVGSNYIWAWENNRILREGLNAAGGSVLAERYLPIGETDHSGVIAAILRSRPDFVFNTLIGTSSYTFFRNLRTACAAAGIDQVRDLPVASCSLSEPELIEIGPSACDGHISSSVYFSTVRTPANRDFVEAYDRMFPSGPAASADAEASFLAVKFLANSISAAGTDDINQIRNVLPSQKISAPQGAVSIDAETFHAHLTPRIGRSTREGQFRIIFEAASPVRPDPYLIESTPRYAAHSGQPYLKVVK